MSFVAKIAIVYLEEDEAINLINNTVSKLLCSEALVVNMKKKQYDLTKKDSVKLILGEIDELN